MRYFTLLIIFAFSIINDLHSQLALEASINTGANFTVETREFHPESPVLGINTRDHFGGINSGINLGIRFFTFDKHLSIGVSAGYLFRYHESGSTFIGTSLFNEKHPEHFLTLPVDLAYHFNFGLGIHLGVESSWIMTNNQSYFAWEIRKQAIFSPMVGLSYSFKIFRFDLLYKHSTESLYTGKYYTNIKGVPGQNIDYIRYRYHDLELRVVFCIYELDI